MTSSHTVVCVGLATLDSVFAVPELPDADGRVVASALAVAGGGPAATAAVAAARLGVPAAVVGAVGDDGAGAAIRAGLADEGVDVSCLAVVPGARSPQSAILVEADGSRAIVHYAGTLPPLALTPAARELCRAASWVHVDHAGYAAASALRADARLSVDGGNPIDGLDLRGLALYAPSEAAIARVHPGLAAAAAARAAVAAGADLVVVTRGGAGCVAATKEGELMEVAGHPVDAVSTLGAGDVFHGALLARLCLGDGLADGLAAANRAAALSTRALDGRSAIPREVAP